MFPSTQIQRSLDQASRPCRRAALILVLVLLGASLPAPVRARTGEWINQRLSDRASAVTGRNLQRVGIGREAFWVVQDLTAEIGGETVDKVVYSLAFDAQASDRSTVLDLGLRGTAISPAEADVAHAKIAGRTHVPTGTAARVATFLAAEYLKAKRSGKPLPPLAVKDLAALIDAPLVLDTIDRFGTALGTPPAAMNSMEVTSAPSVVFHTRLLGTRLAWDSEGVDPDLAPNDLEFLLPDGGFIEQLAEGQVMTELSRVLARLIDPADYPEAVQPLLALLTDPTTFENREIFSSVQVIADFDQRGIYYLTPDPDGDRPQVSTVPLSEESEEAFVYYWNIYSQYTLRDDGGLVRELRAGLMMLATLDFSMAAIEDWDADGFLYPPTWSR